ncbi:tryptophan synthase subunit alpha [Planosporangium thailandense]|uniref:Tryptophan synthase alpha chain n=1 Tax=Planosporangium thailandense TaxID=765197 RepID=A0ABX0Y2Q0_9ACTN|nr:tryptophan synthase subunit alpha [Planosporangium thailandense]
MTGVEVHLREQRARGRKLLVPYLTGGITADWIEYARGYASAGADAIEIGLPFSDPILDGPTIQEASDRALARGVTTRSVLEELAAVRLGVPLIAMTYYNLVVHEGAAAFCAALAAAGVRGLIVSDVPLDEADDLRGHAETAGVELTLLASPVTGPERLARIAALSRGFVYAVSLMGTTGERDRVAGSAALLARRLTALTDRPVLLGFGISTPDHAAEAATLADGVVVGTALMRRILDGATPAQVSAVVAGMRQALDAGSPSEVSGSASVVS